MSAAVREPCFSATNERLAVVRRCGGGCTGMLLCGSRLCHGMFSMVHDFTCSTCVVGLVLYRSAQPFALALPWPWRLQTWNNKVKSARNEMDTGMPPAANYSMLRCIKQPWGEHDSNSRLKSITAAPACLASMR